MTDHHHAAPWSRRALEDGGFRGFVPFSALATADVPAAPGVYAVLRTSGDAPTFTAESPAGRFKGKDPAVAVEVLYIGKATLGTTGKRGLAKRLDEYRRFGAGEPVGHWGGRAVWQLADRAALLVAWNVTEEDPAVVEARMLGDFRERYGVLPFANLRR
jgi:hypothetical protein